MLLQSALLLSVIAPALAETVIGVTIFSRHGSSKHYKGYSLTNLGFQQNYQVGSDYRSLYLSSNSPKRILGISQNQYKASQVFASAPDQQVLLNTATAFLQGLYPPLSGIDASVASETLNNGSSYSSPLNGYQYVVLHGEEANAPDAIWIKGDDGCPAVAAAESSFKKSNEFKQRLDATKAFYEKFWPILDDVYDYKFENMSYANAYDIFDLINVATIHNTSVTSNVTSDDLFQLRTLADSTEWGLNFNLSEPNRSIGGQTLAAALVLQLNQTITSKGALKLSLLAGSYDTFLAFFGIANLTSSSSDFYGLPEYASTIAIELFTERNVTSFPNASDINVRFLFRNGSNAGSPLTAFPLFGRQSVSMSWFDFAAEMKRRSISTVKDWCKICSSQMEFCYQYNQTSGSSPAAGLPSSSGTASSSGGLSTAVAGVIGAVVTLGVIGLIGLLVFLLKRRSSKKSRVPGTPPAEKPGSLSTERS